MEKLCINSTVIEGILHAVPYHAGGHGTYRLIEYVCMRSYIHAELLEGGRENRSESWMYKC